MNDAMKVYTFEEIDRAIAALDLGSEANTLLPSPAKTGWRVSPRCPVQSTRSSAPRAAMPFFPIAWRTALTLLVTAMDEVTATAPRQLQGGPVGCVTHARHAAGRDGDAT